VFLGGSPPPAGPVGGLGSPPLGYLGCQFSSPPPSGGPGSPLPGGPLLGGPLLGSPPPGSPKLSESLGSPPGSPLRYAF